MYWISQLAQVGFIRISLGNITFTAMILLLSMFKGRKRRTL